MTSRPNAGCARRAGSGLAAVALVLLSSGCATPGHRAVSPVSWEQRLQQLRSIREFELSGRVAARDGRLGFSAGVSWRQRDDAATLELSAPLGLGAARVEQSGDALTVTSADGVVSTDSAASRQLAATLGFEPPLRSLRYWVLGASDPEYPAQESIDDQQRLIELEQDGWQVQFGDYALISRQWLPRRVLVQRQELRLKLIVTAWQL